MRKKIHKDFRVVEERTGLDTIYRIKIGPNGNTTTIAQNRDYDTAVTMCENLNKDRWFLDRGKTRADVLARHRKMENV